MAFVSLSSFFDLFSFRLSFPTYIVASPSQLLGNYKFELDVREKHQDNIRTRIRLRSAPCGWWRDAEGGPPFVLPFLFFFFKFSKPASRYLMILSFHNQQQYIWKAGAKWGDNEWQAPGGRAILLLDSFSLDEQCCTSSILFSIVDLILVPFSLFFRSVTCTTPAESFRV